MRNFRNQAKAKAVSHHSRQQAIALWALASLSLLALLAVIMLAHPAEARKGKKIKYSSGTGFFVSRSGHLITNAHVVDKCRRAQITGQGITSSARIVAKDDTNDMALLVSKVKPRSTASFRSKYSQLRTGEKVVIVGHPLGKRLTTASSTLIDDQGPLGEKKWLQFSNSIFKGNSGGPLLDAAGQVIGMVTAKSTLYRYDPVTKTKKEVSNSDIAIRTYVLEKFLKQNHVQVPYSSSGPRTLSAQSVERAVKNHVVKVRCVVDS